MGLYCLGKVEYSWLMTNLELGQRALTEACKELGLQPDVQLLEIKQNTRWVLAFEQSPTFPRFDYAMIKLEAVLREITRTEIELMCESEVDRNKRDKKSGRLNALVNARNVESLEP